MKTRLEGLTPEGRDFVERNLAYDILNANGDELAIERAKQALIKLACVGVEVRAYLDQKQ